MIVYKDCVSFSILGTEVVLYSETLEHGINTVAEVGTTKHYLGHEQPTIAAALLAWQQVNGRELTDDEFKKVLLDNNLFSDAV